MKNTDKELIANELIGILKSKPEIAERDYSKVFSCAYRLVKKKKEDK
jgi:hypothetical protein